MNGMDLKQLNLRLDSLAVFRNLLKDPVIAALKRYLAHSEEDSLSERISDYAAFVSRLYEADSMTLSGHITKLVNENDNPYIRMIGGKKTIDPEMELCIQQELALLQDLTELTTDILRSRLGWKGFLPGFASGKANILEDYLHRCQNIGLFGYGIYAQNPMFYLNSDNAIVPVRNPDPVQLHSLIDYRREQNIIMANTLALLDGKPAANILLTGDAGTGKSSTVKAIVNELYSRGLRILQVRKEQLRELPAILDTLGENPLKFIIFIDDLSFQKDDDDFSALKAILEGSVSAKSRNVVIYATSNRRHLVKETFSQRDGDDIHRNDTMQEIISLSERFGIHVTFQKPDKQTYLNIVHHLALERGVRMEQAELEKGAEQFALGRGGRSARAASQYIDRLVTEKEE